jgi:hypothetical protein
MIGLGSLESDSAAVATYRKRDKNDPELSRAEFVRELNLMTHVPYRAAEIMREISDAVEIPSVRPAYHLPISFGAEDAKKLTPAKMEATAACSA